MRPIINGPNDMEDFKKKMNADMNDKEIVFSKSIKAGKRIYYLDVKKNRKDEMFLAITESKKVVMGEGDDSQVSFEKHKIFLYRRIFRNLWQDWQKPSVLLTTVTWTITSAAWTKKLI